jgi:hypothetical protein
MNVNEPLCRQVSNLFEQFIRLCEIMLNQLKGK